MVGSWSVSILPELLVPTVSAVVCEHVLSEIKCLGRDHKGKQNSNSGCSGGYDMGEVTLEAERVSPSAEVEPGQVPGGSGV